VDFDYTPKSSASIAQVHKACLQSGEIVAVKILRPRIDKIIARDIKTLEIIIKIISLFSEFLAKSFSDIKNVLKESAKSEINLLKEASNAMRLKRELQGVEGFYVPEVFINHTTQKILTLTWIDGIPFSDKKQIHITDFDKKRIAKNLVISYFTQVYSNGFFHADMHPGNLFLMKNGDIGVVDFGIMGEIDKKTRIAVAEIFIGFLNKDYKKVARIHIDSGLVPSTTDVNQLAVSCQKIGETIVDNSVKDVSLAILLAHLIKMTREYKMSTKPELLLLQKTLLLVEGVGVTLDENLNIWDIARPWVREWAKKNISFDAKIRDVIMNFVDIIKKIIT
ncbi:MAG TPA: AarF/UbiB family protein, partial [Rickettsiales bacterium]|nr:AarF/UbiB family protein [Rickettsiales bacterium]